MENASRMQVGKQRSLGGGVLQARLERDVGQMQPLA